MRSLLTFSDKLIFVNTRIKILIVDDMPVMRSIIRNMLEEAGFTSIEEAEDGETAWQLINQATNQATNQAGTDPANAIDLVISDWNMPGMSGADLLRALRTFPLTKELPFLMVTAEGDPAHVTEAVQAGVTGYIMKPFDSAQLREKISQIMTP